MGLPVGSRQIIHQLSTLEFIGLSSELRGWAITSRYTLLLSRHSGFCIKSQRAVSESLYSNCEKLKVLTTGSGNARADKAVHRI